MKKGIQLLFLLLLLFFNSNVTGQTKGAAKIYGYVQHVLGGASPDRSEQPGSPEGSSGTNYFIYLTINTSSRVYPSELWIRGELYGVQVKNVVTTPVLFESNDPGMKKRVLVSKTDQKVIQLIPVSSNGVKKSAKGQIVAESNDVTVVYKLNGKFYYNTLKTLTELENAAMQ